MQALMQQADLLFRKGDKAGSVGCYDQALQLARDKQDSKMEEMVLVGLGFALTNSDEAGPDFARGLQCLSLARQMATVPAAIAFLDKLIENKGKIQALHDKQACSTGGFAADDQVCLSFISYFMCTASRYFSTFFFCFFQHQRRP